MSIASPNKFIWQGVSFFFDTFQHINTHQILGTGGHARIELVFRMTLQQSEDLKGAIQNNNEPIINRLMLEILSHPAAHRIEDTIDLRAYRVLKECIIKIDEAQSSYFPQFFEMQRFQSGSGFGVSIDMTRFTEGDLREKIVSSPDSVGLLRFGLGAIKATRHLHALGLIHRDIKPENLMIRGASVALIDFGYTIPKNPQNISDIHCRRGSVGYSAPERYFGEFSEASDTFSLGMVLYDILMQVDRKLREFPFFQQLSTHRETIAEYVFYSSNSLPNPGTDTRSCTIGNMLLRDPLQRTPLGRVQEAWEYIMRCHYAFVSIGPMWFSLERI